MLIEIERKKIKVPDFIICGAMKSGTTSLHYILASHPLIFIPNPEIHFYDMDNYFQHKDFFIHHKNNWYYPSFTQNISKSFEWYESFFKDAPEGTLIGEDSTIYIASPIAHERIAKYAPNTKIIIMLRDPASRSYSHYSHLFLTGRLTCSFEDAIQLGVGNILNRSLYKQQIENFFNLLPSENFQFILFEEFIKNTSHITKTVLKFLGMPFEDFKIDPFKSHRNISQMPRSITIQKIKNLLTRDFRKLEYADFYSSLMEFPVQDYNYSIKFQKLINKMNNIVNRKGNTKFPPMKPETKQFLHSYFKEQNEGLEKIVGLNIHDLWYK